MFVPSVRCTFDVPTDNALNWKNKYVNKYTGLQHNPFQILSVNVQNIAMTDLKFLLTE